MHNSAGSYMCACASGYTGDGTTSGTGCVDDNECTAGSDDCVDTGLGGLCNNTGGGYTCACASGYTGDGTAGGTGCTDVNECTTGADDCVESVDGGACQNTIGGYTCSCVSGYTGDGRVNGSACVQACRVHVLPAMESVSVNYRVGGSVYRDNNVRAYSNPTGSCGGGSPCDITGWLGFDTSSIADTDAIAAMTLVLDTNTVSGAPTVRVQYSAANGWARTTVTQADLPRTNPQVSQVVTMVGGDVGSFKAFPIDTSNQDFTPDLVDNWLTLGVDNSNLAYTYAYFSGANTGVDQAFLEVTTCACSSAYVATIEASESVSVNYRPGGAEYRDNNVRAYNNPTGNCGGGSPCDITGWLGFDMSSIADTEAIGGITLRLNTDTVSGAPSVRVQYSAGNDWQRSTVTQADLPRSNLQVAAPMTLGPGDVGAFTSFPVDVASQDFSADLVDDWLTLGVDNNNLAYTYAYFSGADAGPSVPSIDVVMCVP